MHVLIGDIGNTTTKICLIEINTFKIKKIIYFNSRNIYSKKFLIVGIGVNIVSNPNIKSKYQATNILLETKKKPKINEILDLIIVSYEKFFADLNSYNYKHFKEKADLMALN